ncbi:MAG TPA: DMT family transporter [Mesorhizobium sp.]
MFVSELLAISAALCIALSGMLINELKGRVDVIRLARWQMLAAFAMTGGAALVIGGWKTIGADEFALLAASSLFGIIIASTTYFAAIYTAGPRTTALLFTLASPFSLLLGYLFLGETIDMRQALGVGLVLAGIAMAVGLRRRDTVAAIEVSAAGVASIALKQSTPAWVGIALGIVTALGQALGSLMARPAMEAGVEPIAAMAVRSGIAALFFLALVPLPFRFLHQPYAFRRSDAGIAIASAFFGTGLGMSLLMAALVTGNVGIVTTLSSMTPIMILPMVWLRSGVPPVTAAWIGAAIAVAGTTMISL